MFGAFQTKTRGLPIRGPYRQLPLAGGGPPPHSLCGFLKLPQSRVARCAAAKQKIYQGVEASGLPLLRPF